MRTIFITGGASGIGAALARRMGKQDRVVLADVDIVGARSVAEELPEAVAIEVDVADADSVMAAVDQTVSRFGGIDVMFNNAGIGIGGPTEELALAHWERAIDVNLRGVIHGIHAVLPVMLEQGSGHIVNTASMAGLVPLPGGVPYATTKHAVVGLTTSLREEFAGRGIRFTVVCPSFVDTPLLDKGMPSDLPPLAERPRARSVAEQSSLGVYAVEDLAEDILSGLAKNEAVLVAPRSARVAWRAYRYLPGLVSTSIRKQTEGLGKSG